LYRFELAVTLLVILLIGSMLLTIEPRWVLVMLSAALAYGSLSSIVSARRLYFLASASPHSALLAVVLSIPLARELGLLDEYGWAIISSILLIYTVGYTIHRGADPDTATATFVALTASTSVLAIYYVLTSYPLETDITALIIGDPLLTRWNDVLYAIGIGVFSIACVLLTYRENVFMGIDLDSARLTGLKTSIYNLLVFTLLALTTVGLLRIVGFVLEHVLILLPAAIASSVAMSSRQAFFISIFSSIIASLAGLYVAILFNLSPAGTTGLILFIIYLISLIASRR